MDSIQALEVARQPVRNTQPFSGVTYSFPVYSLNLQAPSALTIRKTRKTNTWCIVSWKARI